MNLSDDACRALGCPRCGQAAPDRQLGALACERCGSRYPVLGGIPCLVPDPTLWRELWLSRLADYMAATETRVEHLRAEADLPDLLPRTRQRVLRMIGGLTDQRGRLEALFDALKDPGRSGAATIPSRPEPREKLAVLECYENLFRDWCWGEKELGLTRGLVERLAPPDLRGARVAVYGAGAGRLAVDLHQAVGPALTFALDVNPLPLMVAEALVSGRTVELPEFPVAPRSDTDVVITRPLRAGTSIREGLTFLYADALAPPFAAGSLDAVVTCWFIDAVPGDFRLTAAAINRVLRPGGSLINLGPLRFENAASRQYGIAEVHEIISNTGFELGATLYEDVPYFDSPVSGSRRLESLFGFVARKSAEAAPPSIPALVPPWVVDPQLPVPPTPVVMNLGRTSMFTASAISLVDGTRSLADIATALGPPWGVAPAIILDQLRAFFAKLPPG